MFDKSPKKGVTTAGAAGAGVTTAAITNADIAAGNLEDDGQVLVIVDTTAGDVAIDAAAITAISGITGLVEGDQFIFIKDSTDVNRITFTDPGTNYEFNHVNRQTEFLRLTWNGSTLSV